MSPRAPVMLVARVGLNGVVITPMPGMGPRALRAELLLPLLLLLLLLPPPV